MQTAASFSELYEQLRVRLVPFTVAFFVAVFVTYLMLYIVDVYPEPVEEIDDAPVVEEVNIATTQTDPVVESPSVVVNPEVAALPVSITFDALDKTVAVRNPSSADYAELDNELLYGVVRHPQSADFANTGNMLILGHSSYLPTVNNKNFQAFNGIQKLSWGDTIRVESQDTEYIYRVDRVYAAPASDIYVPVGEDTAPKLTLVTCNVFGAKEDRHIVEATLVRTVALK